jgi:hypothetical protein
MMIVIGVPVPKNASFRPSSASAVPHIPPSLVHAFTHDKFHVQDEGKTAHSQFDTGTSTPVDLLTLQQPSAKGNKPPPNTALSRTYSSNSIPPRAQSPISTSPLARSSSGHIANWAVERKQNLFDRKNGKDLNSNNNSTYGFSMTNLLGNGNEDVSVLKAELLELKAQNKIDQVQPRIDILLSVRICLFTLRSTSSLL